MDKSIYDIFLMTPVRESELWKNAFFIFDTSSLCELYNLTEETKITMTGILANLKDRIWIPAQTMYEYQKNRDKVIMNPITEKYLVPKFLDQDFVSTLKNFIISHKSMPYYHPYIDSAELDKLEKQSDELSVILKDIKKSISKQYEKRKEDIIALKKKDCIYDTIISFNIGTPFSYVEQLAIIQEGELRYRNSIPPGYLDRDNKSGTQIYGDLIIWKEILKHSKELKAPIIFICNDIKTDWYMEHNKNSEPNVPRHELIKEFFDTTGGDIWFYTLKQFIDGLENHYKELTMLPLFKGLDAVKFVLEKRAKERLKPLSHINIMTVECKNCSQQFEVDASELDFEWEHNASCERSMGTEVEYIAKEYVNCPNCSHEIEFEFHVWEYPVGSFNYADSDCHNGNIIKHLNLEKYFPFNNSEESKACVLCGKWGELDETGLCSNCIKDVVSDD